MDISECPLFEFYLVVSVSAMLVDTRQKNIAQAFILERYFFCFHLSGSNFRYLLSGVLGGSVAALLMTSDIYIYSNIAIEETLSVLYFLSVMVVKVKFLLTSKRANPCSRFITQWSYIFL